MSHRRAFTGPRVTLAEFDAVVRLYARKLYGREPPNPEYKIPLAASIRNRDGMLDLLRPSHAQCDYAANRTSRNIILKARQTGVTTYIAGRYFLETILRPGTVTLQVAHSLESAQQLFRIVHRYLECLTADKREELKIVRSNVRELAFGSIDSRYIVDTAGNRNAGRGLTVHNLHASEVALWPGDPQETMAALLAAVPPGGQVDIESTPNGAGGYFHSEWLRAKAGEGFTPHFFPWWMEDAYRAPLNAGETLEPFSERERELMTQNSLTLEQIKYRRQLQAQFGERAAQEYAETDAECFLLSGRPVFEVAILEARLRALPAPLRSASNGDELAWLDPEPGHHYVIGADVAEGKSSGDYSAAVVFDGKTGLQCADLLSRLPLHEFAAALARLGKRYNEALLVVERNNHGHAILEALAHSFHYPRIYRHTSPGDSASAAQPGWPTNEHTKSRAVQTLGDALRTVPGAFASRRLLEQCRSFSYRENGATGALPGAHDDLVMAAAIALAARECSPLPQLLAWDPMRAAL